MTFRFQGWVWVASLFVVWLTTWHHLSQEWRLNEQYQYAWVVPFLFLYNGWRKCHGLVCPGRNASIVYPILAVACCCFCTGLLLQWRDPLWRMTGGMLNLGALLLTSAWLYRIGGVPLLQRQSMTLLMVCFTIPWPSLLEHTVTTGLLNFVTSVTTVLLNLLGIAALRHGSLIELSNGWVGMEDACSGINSFQASLMATVCLGELFQLRAVRRIVLIMSGILLCLTANSLRIQGLVWVMHVHGTIPENWHDAIGTGASLLLFLCIGLISLTLSPGRKPVKHKLLLSFYTTGKERYILLPCFIIFPLGILFLQAIQQIHQEPPGLWHLETTRLPPGWRAEALSQTSYEKAILRYSRSQSYRIWNDSGWTSQISQYYWGSNVRISHAAFIHTPDLCMGNQGWTAVGPPRPLSLTYNSKSLTAMCYLMRRESFTRMVVQILLDERGNALLPSSSSNAGWLNRLTSNFRNPAVKIRNEIILVLPDAGDPMRNEIASSQLLTLLEHSSDLR